MGSMADIKAMMKIQGINLDGFEAEAEDIWKSLDDMSEKDPAEYLKFIQNQYEESQADSNVPSNACGSQSQSAPKKSDEDRFFRPIAGFSIKTTTSGGDGIKVRCDGDGKDFYINFCSHPAIEAPLGPNGRKIEMRDFYRTRSADGLQIPMVIGQLRDVDGKTLAVDALFHKSVIDCCVDPSNSSDRGSSSSDRAMAVFKQQIIELAFDWISNDTSVVFSKSWTTCTDIYSGGRGNDKLTPALFSVSHATAQSDSRRDEELISSQGAKSAKVNFLPGGSAPSRGGKKSDGTIQSPSSLLSALRDDSHRSDAEAQASISSIVTSGIMKSNPISKSSTSTSGGSSASTNSKVAPAIKKGFLDSSKKPLYPEGSGEGSGGSKGGSFARVMDKCRVINMADMPSHSPSPALPAATPRSDPVPVSASPTSTSHTRSSAPSSSSHAPASEALQLSQMLLSEELTGGLCSPHFRRIVTASSDVSETGEAERDVLTVQNGLEAGTACTYTTVLNGSRLCLSLLLTGIDPDLFDLTSLQLQVSTDMVRIGLSAAHTAPPTSPRSLCVGGFRSLKLNKDSAVAKLSKKKKTLNVTIQYV